MLNSLVGSLALIAAFPEAMPYTVTFYALRPGLGEIAITVHRVERLQLIAYTGAPAMALGAARTVRGDPKADGFRVVDPEGRIVLDYVDRSAGR